MLGNSSTSHYKSERDYLFASPAHTFASAVVSSPPLVSFCKTRSRYQPVTTFQSQIRTLVISDVAVSDSVPYTRFESASDSTRDSLVAQ